MSLNILKHLSIRFNLMGIRRIRSSPLEYTTSSSLNAADEELHQLTISLPFHSIIACYLHHYMVLHSCVGLCAKPLPLFLFDYYFTDLPSASHQQLHLQEYSESARTSLGCN